MSKCQCFQRCLLGLLLWLASGMALGETELHIGIFQSPPLAEMSAEGVPRGFYVELAEAAAKENGWRLRWSVYPRLELLERIRKGQVDLVLGASRGGVVSQFAKEGKEPLLDFRSVVYALPASRILGFDDLQGRSIGVIRHDVSSRQFLQAADALGRSINVLEYADGQQLLQAVRQGLLDGGLVGAPFGEQLAHIYGLESTAVQLRSEPRFAHLIKGRSTHVLADFDATLARWKQSDNSPYWNAYRRWIGDGAGIGGSPIPMSVAERAWLAQHPLVRVAFDSEFPPYSFRDGSGRTVGLAVDTLEALAGILGIRLEETLSAPWAEVYPAGRERRIDVIATLVNRPERADRFVFTAPYILKSTVAITREDDPRVSQPSDLAGLKVALVKDYQYPARLLADYPSIEPIYVPTILDALNAVATGQADATIGHYASVNHYRVNQGLTSLRFAAMLDRDSSGESIGVRGDWPELASLLDKAFAVIPAAQMLSIRQRWMTPETLAAESEQVDLTDEERAWIRVHPVIRLGFDPDFRPFEFQDEDGRMQGIAADYVKVLNRRLGINLLPVIGLKWPEVVERMRKREVDVVSAVVANNDRRAFLDFSVPYEKRRRAIVTRSNSPLVEGIDGLVGWRVGVLAGSSHVAYLRDHTRLAPILFDDNASQFKAVASGQVDAAISTIGTAGYWISHLQLPNLRIAAPVNEDPLHFGIRSDWPILTRIINKGLASVTAEERREIAQRWIAVEYEPDFTQNPLFRNLVIGLSVLLVLFATVVTWTTSLRNSVRARTAELRGLTRRLSEAQESERRHIVRELHDSVSQNLTGLGYTLHVASDYLDAGKAGDAAQSVETAVRLNNETMAELRALMADLRPPVLDHLGLADALRWFAAEFERRSGLEVVVETEVETPARLEPAATDLFRIVQEALSNAARHAGAKSAFVTLTEERGRIRLVIEDDGRGFDTEVGGKSSYGLLNMRERAVAHGGTLTLKSADGEGTRVEVRI